MPKLNDRIICELQKTEVKDLSRLIRFMNGEKGFFYVRSSGHDHWTNGTAQHSWRVYQYMRYLWEHPEEIPCNRKASRDSSYKADPLLAADEVAKLTEEEIILTGLLHDVGKMRGCDHHASKSKKILDQYLGAGFSRNYPRVVAAIFFHHNSDKDGGDLNRYRNSTLKKLLNRSDGMASGTTWHSLRFKEQRSQHSGKMTSDTRHLRRVAMDRTRQVLEYRMYLDCHYDFQPLIGYASRNILWNTDASLVEKARNAKFDLMDSDLSPDFVTAARQEVEKGNRRICLAVGIEMNVIRPDERRLRQGNPDEETLLICSNIVSAFYSSRDIDGHRYAYTMRPEIEARYLQQSSDCGIYLPDVSFFRDGQSEGFRMVAPWKCDVLLVPNWKGAAILDVDEEIAAQ